MATVPGNTQHLAMQENASEVFVTGFSIRAPESNDVPEFYNNLATKTDMTAASRRYPAGYCGLPPRAGNLKNLDEFDMGFFKYGRKQAENIDYGVRITLEVVQEALLDAKIDIQSLRGSRTGVYIGCGWVDSIARSKGKEELTGYEIVHGYPAMMANKISYFYDFKGPSVALDAACSSSMCALSAAFDDLKSGKVERAVVGGVSITNDPNINRMFNAFTMLSKQGRCHTFDARADGYCRSEGVGVIVLESSRVTQYGYSRLMAVSTAASGAMKEGITYPSSETQASLATEVLAKANVKPGDVSYVEAHGTGTVVGDRIELAGMCKVYPQTGLKVGSVKSNMGHAECASGLMAMIKLQLMYERRKLFPNLNFDLATCPHEPLQQGKFIVPTEVEAWEQPGYTVVMNYGFGGTNGVAVFAPGNLNMKAKIMERDSRIPSVVFGGDAANVEAEAMTDGLREEWFVEQSALGNDSAYKLRSLAQKVDRLDGDDTTMKPMQVNPDSKICFLLDGQGSQWANMGAQLMRDEPVFAETIQRLNEHVGNDLDLCELYTNGDQWFDKRFTVLGLVSYHVGLINLLHSRGIFCDYYMGHSLGETACGYLAGLQTEAQTIQIALIRSELVSLIDRTKNFLVSPIDYDDKPKVRWGDRVCQDEHGRFLYYVDLDFVSEKLDEKVWHINGLMQAYGIPASEIEAAIAELGLEETCVGCKNSPAGQTVTGYEAEMRQLEAYFREKNPSVFIRDIPTDNVAYHAKWLRNFFPVNRAVLKEILGEVEAELPANWISTSGNETWHTGYHAENICGAVLFQQAIEQLPAGTIVMEVGPSSGLLAQIKRTRKDVVPFPVVKPREPENLSNIARDVWLAGGRVRWMDVDMSTRLPLEYRYPNLWDHQTKLPVYDHTDYPLFGKSDTNSHSIKFDLKGEWASIMGHQVCGRVLLPATSYVYAVWDANKFAPLDILDLKIHAALEITPDMDEVKLNVSWDLDGNYRVTYKDELKVSCRVKEQTAMSPMAVPQFGSKQMHDEEAGLQSLNASAVNTERLQQLRGTACKDDTSSECEGVTKRQSERTTDAGSGDENGSTLLTGGLRHEDSRASLAESDMSLHSEDYLDDQWAISAGALYPYFAMHGYQYINEYRRIAMYDSKNKAAVMKENTDWISYLDGILHLLVFTAESNLLPVGFGKISLNCSKNVRDADIWCVNDEATRRLGNTCVVIENARMDPGFGATAPPPSTETALGFLQYGLNKAEDVIFLGQVLQWDCDGFVVQAPETQFAAAAQDWLAPQVQAMPDKDITERTAVIADAASVHLLKQPYGFLVTDGALSSDLLDAKELCELLSFDKFSMTDDSESKEGHMCEVHVYRHTPSLQQSWTWMADWREVQHAKNSDVGFFNVEKGAGVLGFARTLAKEMWGNVHGVYFEDHESMAINEEVRRRVAQLNMRLTYVKSDGEFGCNIERPLGTSVALPSSPVHLKVQRPGNLDSFTWVATNAKTKVAYGALNFRDIMRAFGRLKEVDMSVGLEFSGYSEDGQRIAGIGKCSIGTHVDAVYTVPVPDDMSLADAATIPICYLTVYHALFDKANLKKGDALLVHAGAGGVGMAAIHVCQARGIEVFTTSSDSKRSFIKERFGLDDAHIGNSRNASFKTWILEQTCGRGVDAVLNSLAGDLLTASVECVAPGGHFCEIGKFDIMQNTGLGLRLLERNVSFHVIDLLQLWSDVKVQQRWTKHIESGFKNGEIVALPTHIYEPSDVKEAFRFMSQGKHRGKVLIDFQNGVPTDDTLVPKYYTTGRHLITGGLGGFAMELAKRIADRGAEEVLLLSRSGDAKLDPWQRRQLARLPSSCKVTIVKGHVQSLDTVGDLECIWHTATLYRDALFDSQNKEDWDAVFDTKVRGYENLRKLYPEARMVNFTSVVGGHGNVGQANYAFANEGLEAVARGDNTLSIEWGFVGNVGQAASMADNVIGGAGYQAERVIDLLDFLDTVPSTQTGVVARYALEGGRSDDDDGPVTMEAVLGHIADVLGGSASDYNPSTALEAYGLDSLSMTEIFSWVNRRVSKPMQMTGTASCDVIFEHISKYGKVA